MVMKWIFFFAAFLSITPKIIYSQLTNDTSEKNTETLILSSLMSRKLLNVRPSSCPKCTNATAVNVSLNIIQILGFKESEEYLKISGWFTFKWVDYRLTWNASEFNNRTKLSLPSSVNVWMPDIGLINNVEMNLFDLSSTSKPRLKVSDTGLVTWLQGVVVEVTCPLDVSSFPFDSQECYIIVTPWQSDVDQIVIVPHQIGSAVQNEYLPNSNISEWTITGMKHQNLEHQTADGLNFQFIKFSITMQRKPLYFVIMVIIPFGLLSFLACLIFTLREAPDRLSIALSILLSMTMYVAIVSSNTPRSMRSLPVICIYCMCQLIILSGATIWSVFTCNMFKCDWDEECQWPILNWIFRWRQKEMRRHRNRRKMSLKRDRSKQSDVLETIVNSGEKKEHSSSEDDGEDFESHSQKSHFRKSWKRNFQRILDVVGLVLYLFLSILNTFVCFALMP